MSDWTGMSAAELGRAIGKGEIDPVELTEAYLDAIDSHPHRDRIYARVTHDRPARLDRDRQPAVTTGHSIQ